MYLDEIGMTRAIYVCVVSLVGGVLQVSGIDRDAAVPLLRSIVDRGIVLKKVGADLRLGQT